MSNDEADLNRLKAEVYDELLEKVRGLKSHSISPEWVRHFLEWKLVWKLEETEQ